MQAKSLLAGTCIVGAGRPANNLRGPLAPRQDARESCQAGRAIRCCPGTALGVSVGVRLTRLAPISPLLQAASP
jgi:hypothetical protein